MTTESVDAVALRECPNPWCASHTARPSLNGAYNPWVKLFTGGYYRLVCAVCPQIGPRGETEEAAIAAWNTRASLKAEPTPAIGDAELCKWCNNGCGWYTSYSGGFARWVPCDHCNSDGTLKPDPLATRASPKPTPAPVAGKPVAWVSPGQLAKFGDDPDDAGGAAYLFLRHTSAGNFTMPLYAAPPVDPAPVDVERADVPDGLLFEQDDLTPAKLTVGKLVYITQDDGLVLFDHETAKRVANAILAALSRNDSGGKA